VCVAVCRSVLQCVAADEPHIVLPPISQTFQSVAVSLCVLQCVAACCGVMQCVAVYCSVLQCVAADNPQIQLTPISRTSCFFSLHSFLPCTDIDIDRHRQTDTDTDTDTQTHHGTTRREKKMCVFSMIIC